MLPICYFVVCMTLQQCQQYRQSIQGLFPKHTPIDVFFWTNPEGATVGSTEDFSMQTILQDTNALQHWNFVSPESQNWLPWYHYQADECASFVKLDSGFLFANSPISYPELFQTLSDNTRSAGAAMANIEPSCSISYYSGLDSAGVIVDLSLLQTLLGVYQNQQINANVKFYTAGDFARFMTTYLASGDFKIYPVDLTTCSSATTLSTVAEDVGTNFFVRLAPSGDMMDIARIQGLMNDSPRAVSVF